MGAGLARCNGRFLDTLPPNQPPAPSGPVRHWGAQRAEDRQTMGKDRDLTVMKIIPRAGLVVAAVVALAGQTTTYVPKQSDRPEPDTGDHDRRERSTLTPRELQG